MDLKICTAEMCFQKTQTAILSANLILHKKIPSMFNEELKLVVKEASFKFYLLVIFNYIQCKVRQALLIIFIYSTS